MPAFSFTAQAAVEQPRGQYHTSIDDLIVKVQGGSVRAQRTWYKGQWHHTRAWNDLKLEYGNLVGYVINIERNKQFYKGSSDGTTITFDERKYIRKTATGFRWHDREGNWIDYDANGRTVSFGDRNSVSNSLIYDANGKRTGVSDSNGAQVLWYEYDAYGRVAEVRDSALATDAGVRRVLYHYPVGDTSPAALIESVTDVLGHTTSYIYNNNLRINTTTGGYIHKLTSITDPDGVVTNIAYGPNGRAVSETINDGTGVFYTYNYDKTLRRYYTRTRYSSGRTLESWFDREGEYLRRDINGTTVERIVHDTRKETSTNELGQVTVREYDAFDNLIKITHPDNSTQSFKVDVNYSNITQYTNENGVVTNYAYDATGNLLKVTEAFGKPEQRITDYTYDTYGNVLTVKRLADANTAEALSTYTYDTQGNLKTVTSLSGSATDAASSITINFDTYDNIGNALTVRDGRNNTWSRTYDAKGQLTSVTVPPDEVFSFSYSPAGKLIHVYDPYNKLTETKYDLNGRRSAVLDSYLAKSQFKYDSKGRLIQTLDPLNKPVDYGYDAAGRLANVTDGAGNITTAFYGGTAGSVRSEQLSAIQYPTLYLSRYSD